MRNPLPTTLSIVGLYKCGTSWLLPILCNHPKIVGIPEFDVIRATTGNPKDPFALLPQSERLEQFFCKTPWTSIPNALIKKTEHVSAEEAIDVWATQMNRKWTTYAYDPPSAHNVATPQSFFALNKDIAATFLDRVRNSSSEQVLVDNFLETIASYSCDAQYSVVKAADQIAVFDRLKKLIPNRKCVLIIRDGRDASISALHYRQLMMERGAAWVKQQQRGFPELLKAWNGRVRMIQKLLDAGEDIYVLRYEDLTHNFKQELSSLLTWLELDVSTDLLEQIQDATSFEKKTGRERGIEAKDVLRKGATGEWLETLSREDREIAWKIAGESLSYFGYSQTGELCNWSRHQLLTSN